MCRAAAPSCVRSPELRLSMFSRATYGLLSLNIRQGTVGNGLALPTELHGPKAVAGLEPAPFEGTIAHHHRRTCCPSHRRGMGDAVPAFLPAADRSRTARSNRDLSPPANALRQNSETYRYLIQPIFFSGQGSRADIGRGTSDNGTLGVLPFRPRGHNIPAAGLEPASPAFEAK